MARDTAEALRHMEEAGPLADLMEIRLDVMDSFDLEAIIRSASRPLIITYRSKREGGEGTADNGTRIRYLCTAIDLGADFVDVEYTLPLEVRSEIFRRRRSSKIILSSHLRYKTPSGEELEGLFKKMAATGADVVKIIATAKEMEDNLKVLTLIPLAKKLGIEIIAFCMGPLGRLSRVATVLLGGYVTFASLERGQESAAGQIPVSDMKKIMEALC
jgi:3-dehydroquinate dehydratase type I